MLEWRKSRTAVVTSGADERRSQRLTGVTIRWPKAPTRVARASLRITSASTVAAPTRAMRPMRVGMTR